MSKCKETRLILLGKSGVGKSRTGNSIVGKDKCFHFSPKPGAVTTTCQKEVEHRFGRKIVIVDTPGIFNSTTEKATINKEINQSMKMLSPGPHAILLCVEMKRCNQEDIETLNHYIEHFGDDLKEYTVIVFTHYDEYIKSMTESGENGDLQSYMSGLPENFQEFLSKERYVVFNNRWLKDEMDKHVEDLLILIERMVESNGGTNYTNERYKEIEEKRKRKEEEMKRMEEEKKRKEKEMKEKEEEMKKKVKEMEEQMEKKNEEMKNMEDEIEKKEEDMKKKEEDMKKMEKFYYQVGIVLGGAFAAYSMTKKQ